SLAAMVLLPAPAGPSMAIISLRPDTCVIPEVNDSTKPALTIAPRFDRFRSWPGMAGLSCPQSEGSRFSCPDDGPLERKTEPRGSMAHLTRCGPRSLAL